VRLLRTPDRVAAEQLVQHPDGIPLVILRGSGDTTRSLAQKAAQAGVAALAHADGGGVLYVHPAADRDTVTRLIDEGTDRLGVCNRLNLLLVDTAVFDELVPGIREQLAGHQPAIELVGPSPGRPLGWEWALDDANNATVTVAPVAPAVGTPGGTVNVSDGTGGTCTITLAAGAGSCSLTSTTAGAKTLTANYVGDSNFNPSSDTEAHQVDKGDTTTTITSDSPDPSKVGQPYTVSVTVAPVAPAVGTPGGTVTVSDGTDSCVITLAAGTGSCSLTSTTAGAKTLTATYGGDANFNGSSDTESHQVDKGDTTTAITSDSPDPSVVGQPVPVNYTVSVVAPAAGTPTGNVTVTASTGESSPATSSATAASTNAWALSSSAATCASSNSS